MLKSVQLLFLLFLISISYSLASEKLNASLNIDSCDNIILRNGEEISCKVIEIGIYVIKYKKCVNLDGPLYNIKKTDVFMIKYINGEKDVIIKRDVEEGKEEIPIKIDSIIISENENLIKDAILISENEKLIKEVLAKKEYSEENYTGIEDVAIGDIVKFYTHYWELVYGIVVGFQGKNKVIFYTYPTPGARFDWQENYTLLKKIKYR